MCELLVRRRDAPVEESPGKWHSGDVVVVMPDGHKWGRKEADQNGVFAIIKFPGVPVEEMADLVELHEEENSLVDRRIGDDTPPEMIQIARRKVRINMRKLPKDKKITPADLRAYKKNGN